ncbi:MAG: hypothetical protein FJ077_07510 [Cyanobacteria bacterium K_DeepCast_35m_m2_023]|nr:hypothetical protein [Cyanobacteria bacterium K_DeepCast_35m_m2_023]
MSPALRRELPWLAIEIALLVVLLHSNPPELWFWFAVLVVLQIWRHWLWRSRTAAAQARALEDQGQHGS